MCASHALVRRLAQQLRRVAHHLRRRGQRWRRDGAPCPTRALSTSRPGSNSRSARSEVTAAAGSAASSLAAESAKSAKAAAGDPPASALRLAPAKGCPRSGSAPWVTAHERRRVGSRQQGGEPGGWRRGRCGDRGCAQTHSLLQRPRHPSGRRGLWRRAVGGASGAGAACGSLCRRAARQLRALHLLGLQLVVSPRRWCRSSDSSTWPVRESTRIHLCLPRASMRAR